MTTAPATTKERSRLQDREAISGGLGESLDLIVHRFHSIYSRLDIEFEVRFRNIWSLPTQEGKFFLGTLNHKSRWSALRITLSFLL